MAQAEEGAIAALALVLANPPPQVVGLNEFKRVGGRGVRKLADIDSVSVTLQEYWPLAHQTREEEFVARLIEASHGKPGSFRGEYIFRVAV
jgi:hypothetical protein